MALDEEIQNALVAIHSRLGTIEGKVTLMARADRERVLKVLEEVVRRTVLVGQIYLVLNGKRTQREVRAELSVYGINTSEATISRRMAEMATEHGIADLVRAAGAKVYRKNREMEDVLNLSKNMRSWLEDESAIVPVASTSRGSGSQNG